MPQSPSCEDAFQEQFEPCRTLASDCSSLLHDSPYVALPPWERERERQKQQPIVLEKLAGTLNM